MIEVQMSKVKFHTIEQPESDTTTFILGCNRLDLLERTMKSFLDTRDYVTKMVIVDDSAEDGVFEHLVEKYGDLCDVICFPRNRSQWWAMDFMVSYCDSEYIFYLEEDWQFTQTGYLNKSKEILKKYRDIGTVDISFRTFEWEGHDTYDKELIDNSFFYKKPWQISDYHLSWYGWIGSPNLKRRDDLILLGRIEKWHNEWNIDRKFMALGFKSIFLDGVYVKHLGDYRSSMDGKRPNDGTTPEHYYPEELQKNRIWPKVDYTFLDKHWQSPWEVCMVTAFVDIGRNDRDFAEHYLEGVKKVLQCRNPMVVYAEEKHHEWILQQRKTLPIQIRKLELEDIKNLDCFSQILSITSSPEWQNQSEWMKKSIICSPYYIPLTLVKNQILQDVATSNPFPSKKFYWIDSGICSSFGITEHIDTFNFNKIPDDKFFLTSFPYDTDSEIHGYSVDKMTQLCRSKPDHVCRATLFGGTKEYIIKFNELYFDFINRSLKNGCIGTEESIFTIVDMMYPHLIHKYEMPNGDIKNYLNVIRSKK